MNRAEIVRLRLQRHGLSAPETLTPVEVVRRQGAMQAQEFGPAKWSIGQRIAGATDPSISGAIDAGEILRTHVLRPTWHFVAPGDIRWLLELTGPRVHQSNAGRCRDLGLDDATLARSDATIVAALEGGRHWTRTDLADHLKCAGIDTTGQRLPYILMHAELDGLICSGPVRGKHQTYALISERAPQAKSLARDEALAKLIRRYYTSHGPATINDFTRWCSLTVTDTKRGIDLLGDQLRSATVDGRTYWFGELPPGVATEPSPTAHLLQAYDEYTNGYGESRDVVDPFIHRTFRANGYMQAILIDGQVAGAWKRTIRAKMLQIGVEPFRTLTVAEQDAVNGAAEAHAQFVGLTARVTFE
jgi:winged helix DNA-binding protein